MNEVKFASASAGQKNAKAKYSAILFGSLLMLAGAREARAAATPLPLRSEPNGVHIHNGVTSQTIETAFGTNLLGLAFTGTTTYDFYSPPLSTNVNLTPSDKGGGMIYMRNTGTSTANDFKVSGRMQFFDYDPATGTQTLIVDTTASPTKDVDHGLTVNWAIPNALLPGNATIPAGHMIHIAMTIALVSGHPGNSGQVLYNGPSGASTVAYLPQNSSVVLNWPLASVVIPPPANLVISLLSNGAAQITSSGTAGATYLIQATTNLSLPSSWIVIGTNVVGTNGLTAFIDRDSTNYPSRFYRFAAP